MPAPYTTITLDGGPSTVSLTDPDNFQLQENGYSIVSPRRLRSGLAGPVPYEPVIGEEIRINLYGSTGAVLLANKSLLEEIIDQAARWYNREPITPIKLEILAQGSAFAQAVTTIVTGGQLILPDQFFDKLMVTAIEGVTLSLDRLPVWLSDEEIAVSSAANVPNIQNITFIGDPNIASPVELLIDGFSAAAISDNWLLVAENAADLKIVEAEAAVNNTTAGTWATQADGGKNPRGGTIGRYTAADTNWQNISLIALGMAGKDLSVFAAIRQNDSTRTWRLKADSSNLSGGGVNDVTRPITLDYNTGKPQIVYIGSLTSAAAAHDVVRIYFQADSASGSPTLDFDYFVLQITDHDGNMAIHTIPADTLSGNFELRYDHQLLTKPDPAVLFEVGANITPLGYDTPPIVYSRGLNLSAVWLACYDDQWVHTPTAKGGPSNITLTATRRRVYLTPE